MRSIVARKFGLLLLAAASAACQPRFLMGDPVFGVTYDTREVHFQLAPSKIGELCRGLRGRTFWLYGYWKEKKLEYFVLSDRVSEDSGVGALLQDGRCIEGLPDWVLSGDAKFHPYPEDRSVVFTQPALHGLASDLLRRYAVAFGGKQKFLSALKKGGIPSSDFLPVLRSEFEKFANSP